MIFTLILAFMSWSCHSVVICVPFQLNTTCSVECGRGTVQSITTYLDSNRVECKPEERSTFPCEVNSCTTGQECSFGICTPQWHWQQPNTDQSFKLVNLTKTPERGEYKNNHLFYIQNAWVKLQVYSKNLSVSWSNDSKVWDKVDLDLPTDSSTYNLFSVSYADVDVDGKLYLFLEYLDKDFTPSAALYTIINKDNITMEQVPYHDVVYIETKALNGVIYIFYKNNTDRLSYFIYENGTFSQDVEIDNSVVFPFHSFEKGKDFIAVVGNSLLGTEHDVTISSFIIYQNGTTTQPAVIAHVGQSTPMDLERENDSWILVWYSVDTSTIEVGITKDFLNWKSDQFKSIPFLPNFSVSNIEVESGSNGTILIILSAPHHLTLYHNNDIFYSLSVDYGKNWSSFRQITNLEEITPIKTASDTFLALATDMNGWFLSIWYQVEYGIRYLNEASSLFYVDTKCLDDINCYAFDGNYNYVPKSVNRLPVSLPPGNYWAVKNIINTNNLTINGSLLSTAMSITYRDNSTILITGNLSFTQYLNIGLSFNDLSMISTDKVLNISPNTTLTVTIPNSFKPTNLKLITFTERSGTFSNVLINENTCQHSIVQRPTGIELIPVCDPTQHLSSSSTKFVSIGLLAIFCLLNLWNTVY